MSHGVGCKLSLDLALLWLWCRPAAAVQIQPLAWELLYAGGAAQKGKKKRKKKKTCVFNTVLGLLLDFSPGYLQASTLIYLNF